MRAKVSDVVRHSDTVPLRNRRGHSAADRLLRPAVGDPADRHCGALRPPRPLLLVRSKEGGELYNQGGTAESEVSFLSENQNMQLCTHGRCPMAGILIRRNFLD